MVDKQDLELAKQHAEDQLNRVFHSLADPSRRRIIALLREAEELSVGDIAAAFDMSLNGVSKHLKVLEAAQLVVRRVEGRSHRIRVNWESLQPPYEWLHFYHHFWSERLDALVDYVKDKNQKAEVSKPTPRKSRKGKQK